MVPGRHPALDRYDAGTAEIESRRLAQLREADLSADPDEGSVLALLADVLVGESHWTVGEVRQLLDLRDATRTGRDRAGTEDQETAPR
jgi:hypothetical protein